MDSTAIHDYARRLVGAHGDKAELEAAQRAASCERQGDKGQAADWRKIQAAIKALFAKADSFYTMALDAAKKQQEFSLG